VGALEALFGTKKRSEVSGAIKVAEKLVIDTLHKSDFLFFGQALGFVRSAG
jgi:hypothetical protein